jgi:hypothetical protein
MNYELRIVTSTVIELYDDENISVFGSKSLF